MKHSINNKIQNNHLSLWYRQPSREGHTGWEEDALPVGNGFLGMKVYGGIETECLQLNEKSLWRGTVLGVEGNTNGNGNGDGGGHFREIRKLLREKRYEEARNKMVLLQGDEDGLGAYQNLGSMYLHFPGVRKEDCSGYTRGLDLETACVWTQFDNKGESIRREAFVSYPDKVGVICLTGRMETVVMEFMPGQPVTKKKVASQGLLMNGYVGKPEDQGLRFTFGFRVETDGELRESKSGMVAANSTYLTIYLTAATDYGWDYPAYRTSTGPGPEEIVEERLKNAAGKGYQKLLASHLADYQPLFARMTLNLGEEENKLPTDELLRQYQKGQESRLLELLLFQYGRYLLLASSREGALPANLQGIWNDSNTPVWQSDYHLNINLQMNYWHALSTSLPETMEPLFHYVNQCLVIPGRQTAKAYTGIGDSSCSRAEGWMAHTQNNIFGHTGPGSDWRWGWAPAVGAFILQNTYEYYRFTQDTVTLAGKIYPAMEECARMWSRLLTEDEETGRLVASPCFSPEHGPVTAGNAFDQTLVWQLYTDTLEAAAALRAAGYGLPDEELIALLEKQLPGIVPCETGYWGQVREWMEEDNWENRGFDTMGVERCHRHFSHIMGLFPGHYITEERPRLMEAAKVSLLDRGEDGPGWSMALRLLLWARLGSGERCGRYLGRMIRSNIYPNLWSFHPPFQIDGNFGLSAGVAEMLLTSFNGVINLLPALMPEWSEKGEVKGLSARGNCQVDISWEKGLVTQARILARSGGDFRILYNRKERQVSLDKGESVYICESRIQEKG